MSTTLVRGRPARGVAARVAVAALATAVGAAGVVGLATAPASAVDMPATGDGEVHLTSASTTSISQRVYFSGSGFAVGGNQAAPGFQKLWVKIDDQGYSGTANAPDGPDAVKQVQVQADGSVSGFVEVPADIDDPGANTHAGDPHWLRLLGSNPIVSQFTDEFTVDAGAAVAPRVEATATTTTGRRAGVRIDVSGTGFAAGEDVTVTTSTGTGLTWSTGATTLATGADGTLTGTVNLAIGDLDAGEHQLVFDRSSAPAVPSAAQVTVDPAVSLAGLNVGGQGTVTVSGLAPGARLDKVVIDPAGAATTISDGGLTAGDDGVATGTVTIPEGTTLGTHDFNVSQTFPYPAGYAASAKVSPSGAAFGAEKFARVETADGVIEQGLYQSAYSRASKALFVTTANVTSTSTLYKLDPNTLAVKAQATPPQNPAAPGTLFAAYGVGLDDEHGTVWVTNTRQNTVAVYRQSDLSLVKQFDPGTVSHSRDVVVDEAHDRAFVTSASEGSGGDAVVAVFSTGDSAAEITQLDDIELGARTSFSPMSLELDEVGGTVYTVSSTTPRALAIDTDTLEPTFIELEAGTAGANRASGVAYDAETNRLFVASQNSDNLLIADATTGDTIVQVPTGAQALNVALDPVHELAYVTNFGGTGITVLDYDGNPVANLMHQRANHVAEDGLGSVYSVNKDAGNTVLKLTPKVLSTGGTAIAGIPQVGRPLTARPGTWPAGARFGYQWQRGTSAIPGATGATYTPTAADAGRTLAVVVTATANGFAPGTARATSATVRKGALSSAKPTVKGKLKVGKKVRVRPGTWTAGTALGYRWYAGKKPISGKKGAKATLKLTKKLAGKRLRVKVTGTKAGYTSVTKASKKTAKVKTAKKGKKKGKR